MREIKFRVPIQCARCEFKGFQYWEWNGQAFVETGYDKCSCVEPAFEIVGDAEQYTGLKDKNGKEIYTKDFVIMNAFGRVCYGPDKGLEFDYDFMGEIVILPSKGVCLKNPLREDGIGGGITRCKQYKPVSAYRSRVIGNRHQNPELLEAE